MRILVCGGRDFDDWHELHCRLIELTQEKDYSTNEVVIMTGDACGADWLARTWAKWEGIEYLGFPADWKKHGKAAGGIRNQQMLDEGKPDLVVAFPGGVGTADMVRRARKSGVEVIEVAR